LVEAVWNAIRFDLDNEIPLASGSMAPGDILDEESCRSRQNLSMAGI
jgi:hypothetical protein